MLVFTNRLRLAAWLAIGALTLVLGHFTEAQACHRGGGGGGYAGNGYPGGGYPGGNGQPYNSGAQDYPSPQDSNFETQPAYPSGQPANSVSGKVSLNNPATVLNYQGDLNLASNQVLALEKMAASGKYHAANVLTAAQRKQLAVIVGILPKSGATVASQSSGSGASSFAASQ